MRKLFTIEQRWALHEAKKMKPGRRQSKSRPKHTTVYKVPHGWAEKWADKIIEPLSSGIADLIAKVAQDKDIGHPAVSYYAAKSTFKKAAKPRLVKLLNGGDISEITDYDGRSGEFDREVVAPGLKAVFASLGAKYRGFGPLSIQMRLKKMTRSIPGDDELYDAADELQRIGA